jgi:NNP family nitrate/nitrite transporter-like MFS transporter
MLKDHTPNKQLFLATIAFTMAFANWGLISGLATLLKSELRLSATEASLMIALPVILGSIGRIPMGLLTDRYGGRLIFSALLLFGLIPPTALALNHSYPSLLFWGFWLGLAGSSFAIGIGFVSLWFPPEKQGTALGVYGVGNIGQSIAVFFGPVLANRIGIPGTLLVFGLGSLAWGLVFAIWSRNAQKEGKAKTLQESIRVLYTEPLSWVLSLFYFLTFGGFVALGIYLPTLLKETFGLTPEDAGARTAGFIILATLARPAGGWLSDRVGGQRLLIYVFGGIALCAWLLATASMIPFTVGALGCAALLGLGNGAVFKLVAQYFPTEVGTVTGLVGAAGGLGGFFPPIVLGALKDASGSYTFGFILLSAVALGCWFVLWAAFLRVHRLPQVKPAAPNE